MKIITWNVNSIRLRSHLIYKILELENPEILCLQECKRHPPWLGSRRRGTKSFERNGRARGSFEETPEEIIHRGPWGQYRIAAGAWKAHLRTPMGGEGVELGRQRERAHHSLRLLHCPRLCRDNALLLRYIARCGNRRSFALVAYSHER